MPIQMDNLLISANLVNSSILFIVSCLCPVSGQCLKIILIISLDCYAVHLM